MSIAGQAVTREELAPRLWPGYARMIDIDDGLNAAARKLHTSLCANG